MTYTFKLSRRIARLRAAGLAVVTLAVLGCDGADPLEPGNGTPVDAAPGAPALPSASFAGGIPMGLFALPTEMFGGRYNGALRNIGPYGLKSELAAIKSRGGRIVLMMAGSQKNYRNTDGTFSLSKWKQRIDRFRSVDFSSYVSDGTIIAHYLIDEPYDPANWSGEPVSGSTLEEMARYSKTIWPGLPTVVRAEPRRIAWNGTYRYLDAAWAQYRYSRGEANEFIQRNVAEAQQMGLGLVVGLNLKDGGNPNNTYMSPSEIESWGSALLSSSYPCAFISWSYEFGMSDYLATSAVEAAMDRLRAKAQNRTARTCRRTESSVTPPPPDDPPTTEPVSGVLPFGIAKTPAGEYSSGWTGAVYMATPTGLASRLASAQENGVAVIAQLAPMGRTKNADGTFSLTKWKAEVDRYRSLPLGGYVSGKTLYLHYLVHKPRCASCWGGTPIPWQTIEEMARYSETIWPALPTGVGMAPSALAKAGINWTHLDAGWAQYDTRRGDVRTWLSTEVAKARLQGLGLVGALSLLDASGPGTPSMTPSQIQEFGTVLAREPAMCAVVGWTYDSAYLEQTGIRSALASVLAAAKERSAASCTGT